ncbi:retrovirus-related pol polyprotein from transposon TNT 1-94 [Tanacetum coccineum]
MLPSTIMKSSTSASRSQPSSNTKNSRILRTTSSNMKNKVEDLPRSVVQIVMRYLDSGCSKHMTENCSYLINFVHKFLGTIRIGNNQIAKIMVYGDYQMGNVTISRVYYVEGLGSKGSNLYTLCLEDMMPSSPICILSKASKINSWLWHRRLSHLNFDYITTLAKQGRVHGLPRLKIQKDHLCSACALDNSTEFVNQTLRDYYEDVRISHQTSVVCSPQQNDVFERRNRTLVEAARTMLIFSKAPLLLWAKAVATACFTQNRSLIRKRYNKTPYELLHNKKPDLSYFHVFGALCYPTNDSEDLGKLKPKADIGIFVGYAPTKKAFRIYNKRTRLITETVQVDFDELTAMASEQFSSSTHDSWNTQFRTRPMYNEYFNPPPSVASPVPIVVDPDTADSTITPSSTTIDQDAPSPNNDPFFGIPIPEPTSEESSSRDVIPTNVHSVNQPPEHLSKWIKDHPLDNVILDELGGFLKNKARLVARGFRQEEGIDFEESFAPFSKGTVDPTFTQKEGKDILLVQIYVDDIIFASTDPSLCETFSKIMCLKFKMSMMGKMLFFLGLQISQSLRGIFLNQSKYALEIIKKYGMETSDPMDIPMVEKSKLDTNLHGKEVDPTRYHGMIGFHADHAGCQDTKRSTSDSMQLLGRCAQILWMRSQLTDYGLGFNKIPLYCDNKSAIALCCNNVQHSRSKHIDIRYHFIKEQVENGVVELYFIKTEYELAGIFTKALGLERLAFLINKLGMRSMSLKTLKRLAEEEEE